MKLKLVARLMPVVALCFTAAVACGGGDEGAEGAPQGTVEERLIAVEGQMHSLQEYVVAQAQKAAGQKETPGQVVVLDEGGGDSDSPPSYRIVPQYSLSKDDASENEKEIVVWMADCAARTYLNPNLPAEVIDREIVESERRMWDALESGQYSSFENYIGMAFSFCQARIVQENQQ